MLYLGQDLPHKNGSGVSDEPKEHQQTYQNMEQEQAQVSEPPAANENSVSKEKLMYERDSSSSLNFSWGKTKRKTQPLFSLNSRC